MSLRPITDWCSHHALFFDANGRYLDSRKIKYKDRVIYFKGNAYNFLPDNSTFFKYKTILGTKKFYFYSLGDPMPLILKTPITPFIFPDVYKNILDADLIKKLNDLPKTNFLSWLLKPQNILIVLVILAAIYYFANGGKIT